MNKDIIMTALFGVVLGIILGLILALPVMWLWNSVLIAAIPGIKEIGWIQAWGIMLLCQFLFKGVEVKTNS